MKKILLLFLSCFSCTIAEAQTTPPLFQGSDDVQLFRQALMERVTEVYYSDGYTPIIAKFICTDCKIQMCIFS